MTDDETDIHLPQVTRSIAILERPRRVGELGGVSPASATSWPGVLQLRGGLLQPELVPGQWPPPVLSYLALAAILSVPRHDHPARSLDDPDRTATDESSRSVDVSADDGRNDELRVREVIRRAPPDGGAGTSNDTGTGDGAGIEDDTGTGDGARTENASGTENATGSESDTGARDDARTGPRSWRTAPDSPDPGPRAGERRTRNRGRRSTRDPRTRQRGSSADQSDVPAPSTVVRSNRADENDGDNSPLGDSRSPRGSSRRATDDGNRERATVVGQHPTAGDPSVSASDGTPGTARSSADEHLRARTVLRDPGRAPQVTSGVTERTVTRLVNPADAEGARSSTASAASTSTGGGWDRREGAAASPGPVPLSVTAAGSAGADPRRTTTAGEHVSLDAPRMTVRRDREASDVGRSGVRNRSGVGTRSAGRSGSVSGMVAGSSVGDRAGSAASGQAGPAGSAGSRPSNSGGTGRAGAANESDPAALAAALDVPRLADRLYRELERKMRIERERRGRR